MTTDIKETVPATEEPATESVGLSVEDLKVMMQIIQVVGSRGAIKAEEMEIVGGLYSKLFRFLKAAGAITEESPEATNVKAEDVPAAPAETA